MTELTHYPAEESEPFTLKEGLQTVALAIGSIGLFGCIVVFSGAELDDGEPVPNEQPSVAYEHPLDIQQYAAEYDYTRE